MNYFELENTYLSSKGILYSEKKSKIHDYSADMQVETLLLSC